MRNVTKSSKQNSTSSVAVKLVSRERLEMLENGDWQHA